MRTYYRIPKKPLEALPKLLRAPLERAIEEILPSIQTVVVSSTQRLGALVVDEAVEKLGLGRFGVRLSQTSLSPAAENWEVSVLSWSPASIGEATSLSIHRALEAFFDLQAGEWFGLENLNIRWLGANFRQGARSQASSLRQSGGSVLLKWTLLERENFRRRVLENLELGASEQLGLTGLDDSGIAIVEIDVVVRAKARAQIAAQKD
jgi:hypothetical protein